MNATGLGDRHVPQLGAAWRVVVSFLLSWVSLLVPSGRVEPGASKVPPGGPAPDPAAARTGALDLPRLRASLETLAVENCGRLEVVRHLGGGGSLSLAWSVDGELVAVNTASGLALYRLEERKGRLRAVRERTIGPQKVFLAACFLQGGSALATSEGDSRVELWSCSTGEVVEKRELPIGEVESMDADRKGMRLVVSASDGFLRVWDRGTLKEEPRKIALGGVNPGQVRLSPDAVLAAVWNGRQLEIYDLSRGVRLKELTCEERIRAVTFHPESTKLYTFSKRQEIVTPPGVQLPGSLEETVATVWGLPEGRLEQVIRLEKRAFTDIESHPGRNAWVLCSPDEVSVIDAGTGRPLGTLVRSTKDVQYRRALFDPRSGERVALVSDRSLDIFDVRTRRRLSTAEVGDRPVTAGLSPDGEWLVWGPTTASLTMLHLPRGTRPQPLRCGVDLEMWDLAVAPRGRYVAARVRSDSGWFRLWRVQSGRLVGVHAPQDNPLVMEFTPDGRWLLRGLVTRSEPKLDLLPLRGGDAARRHSLPWDEKPAVVADVAASRDGRLAVVSVWGLHGLCVIDLESGKEVKRLRDVVSDPRQDARLEFSGDGRFLLVSTGDGDAKLVEMPSGRVSASLEFTAEAYRTAMSSDGKLLAGGLQIWKEGGMRSALEIREVATRACKMHALCNLDHMSCLAFLGDGKLLLTAGGGTVRFWGVRAPAAAPARR